MKVLEEVTGQLAHSSRAKYGLQAKDLAYLEDKGLEVILEHARDFVAKRLAPAEPKNDGKQTPWRGHPAFVAQHATATCCRGCLERWHAIPKGRALDEKEQAYVVDLLRWWLSRYNVAGRREIRAVDGTSSS